MRQQFIASLTIMILLVTGCNFGTQENITPTPDTPIEETLAPPINETNTPAPTATLEPTPTPTITPTLEPSLTPFPTQGLPTDPPAPTETPEPIPTDGPWEHTVLPNQQLIEIIQIYGYRTLDVIPEIVAINANIATSDILPVGEVILIPRPTTAPAIEQEQAVDPVEEQSTTTGSGIPEIRTRDSYTIPPGYQLHPYQVQGGDDVITIVERTEGLTLALFNQYNAEILFPGCNFELPGGGPNCNPLIREGQWVNILTRQPPPTPTSTPIGNETSTPTPTISAPQMVSPPDGGLASGSIQLSWIATGLRQEGQIYVVTVHNLTNGSIWTDGTSHHSIRLPNSIIPPTGEEHEIEWHVAIGSRSETGDFYITGGQAAPYRFRWRG